MPTEHIGEVIEAHSMGFRFQLKPSDMDSQKDLPALGSLVKVHLQERAHHVLGLVYHVETKSIDSIHRPVALNMTRQELREQQPQIFDLLKTDVLALTLGYQEGRTYFQYLPPYPPLIHDFVYACTPDEIHDFTERLIFLRTLLSNPNTHDEVIAAFLRHSYQMRKHDQVFLKKAGQELSRLLKDDYDRLVSIVQRLDVATSVR